MAVGVLLDVGKSFTSFENSTISIDLDVTQDEAHEWKNDVTLYPVEEGSQISDNIRRMPDKLTITGWITDSPINDESTSSDNTSSRVSTTFGLLHDLMEARELMTVYTRHKVYTNMALQSCNIPRNGDIGEALNFTLEFVNVRIVSTQTVDVPAGISKKLDKKSDDSTKKKTQPKQEKGSEQTKDLNKSGAASITDALVKAPSSVKDFLSNYGVSP
jgi:hypothetical protein